MLSNNYYYALRGNMTLWSVCILVLKGLTEYWNTSGQKKTLNNGF